MSDEQKTSQKECCPPFEGMSIAAMMEKMMTQQGEGCDRQGMMSQMMAMCGAARDEEETTSETTQRA